MQSQNRSWRVLMFFMVMLLLWAAVIVGAMRTTPQPSASAYVYKQQAGAVSWIDTDLFGALTYRRSEQRK